MIALHIGKLLSNMSQSNDGVVFSEIGKAFSEFGQLEVGMGEALFMFYKI